MGVIIFIAVLVLLIVGHEFGHFLTAKLLKMKVLEFGVGFPPRVWGKKIGETLYSINWIPFGGFVRIFGEDEKEAEDPVAFPNRPKFHQALVLFAGPFANIVLAFFLSSAAFFVGTLSLIDTPSEIQNVKNPYILIAEVVPSSPAADVGIQPGDKLVSISAQNNVFYPTSAEDVGEFIAAQGSELLLSIVRGGEDVGIIVEATSGLIEDSPERKAIGIRAAYVGIVSYPLHVAIWQGVVDTARDFVFILVSLASLIGSAFTLSADVSQIAGPIGIATLTGDAAALGVGALFSFAALLSVNLAIINLLPFPALDGGRLLFLGLEVIFRKKIPLKIAQNANLIGFAVLILLMVVVTFGDISRLIG